MYYKHSYSTIDRLNNSDKYSGMRKNGIKQEYECDTGEINRRARVRVVLIAFLTCTIGRELRCLHLQVARYMGPFSNQFFHGLRLLFPPINLFMSHAVHTLSTRGHRAEIHHMN